MSKWENYGDVNFAEYGGILLKQGYDAEQYPRLKGCYDFIQVCETDDFRKFAITGSIDIGDYESKRDEILQSTGIRPSEYSNPDEAFAFAVVDYYGGEQLDGRPIIQDAIGAKNENIPYLVIKSELCDWLNEVGFDVTNEELQRVQAMDNKELANEIEDFMYDRGEYDYPTDEYVKWIDKEGDRSKTVDNIEKALEKGKNDLIDLKIYIKGEIAAMSQKDELLDFAVILDKVLDERSDKTKEKSMEKGE